MCHLVMAKEMRELNTYHAYLHRTFLFVPRGTNKQTNVQTERQLNSLTYFHSKNNTDHEVHKLQQFETGFSGCRGMIMLTRINQRSTIRIDNRVAQTSNKYTFQTV